MGRFSLIAPLNFAHLRYLFLLISTATLLNVSNTPRYNNSQLSLIDMKHVDVILISNYRSILALPYITERSEFAGVVYATEPSLTLGRLYMEELVVYIERNPKLKRASAWK